jgi:hypothetical protein
MKKTFALLASVAAFSLGAPAFAADTAAKVETKVEQDSKGNYDEKTKTEKTDAAGTTVSTEKKVDVDVDSKGNVEKTATTKETTDPKGLMNKHTEKTKDTVKTKHGKTVHKHKKSVNGKTTENTTTETPAVDGGTKH